MQPNPKSFSPQVPSSPRTIMAEPLWPFWITHELTAQEIRDERFIHALEIEAVRPESFPAWARALAGALAGLGVAS